MIQNVNKLKKAQMSKSKTDIIYDPILGHSRKGRDEEHISNSEEDEVREESDYEGATQGVLGSFCYSAS